MTLHKPTILYYDHGNSEKRAAVEKALREFDSCIYQKNR